MTVMSLCTARRHVEGVQVWLHSLNAEEDGGEWSA